MNLKQHLDYLFNPRSVAVIGASNAFGKWGFGMVGLLDDLVGAVNMATDEVDKMLQAAQGEELRNLDTTIELMRKYQKPVIFTTMISDAVRRGGVYDKLEQNYLTPCSTPEMAAKVLAHLVRYSEYRGILKGN